MKARKEMVRMGTKIGAALGGAAFLIFGIIIGITEDIIAIKVATHEPITFNIVAIVFLIAIPFAILGELVVDKIDFIELFRKWKNLNRK